MVALVGELVGACTEFSVKLIFECGLSGFSEARAAEGGVSGGRCLPPMMSAVVDITQ